MFFVSCSRCCARILILNLRKDHRKILYERFTYESVDDSSLSYWSEFQKSDVERLTARALSLVPSPLRLLHRFLV